MTQDLTNSKFIVRADGRKFLNSPPLGLRMDGCVSWHDGETDIFTALHKIVDLAQAECAGLEFFDGIQITLITKKP